MASEISKSGTIKLWVFFFFDMSDVTLLRRGKNTWILNFEGGYW